MLLDEQGHRFGLLNLGQTSKAQKDHSGRDLPLPEHEFAEVFIRGD